MNERQKKLLERYKKNDGAYPPEPHYMVRDAAFMKAWKNSKDHTVSQIVADMMLNLTEFEPLDDENDTFIAGLHLRESVRWPQDSGSKEISRERKIELLRKYGVEETPEEIISAIDAASAMNSNLSAGKRDESIEKFGTLNWEWKYDIYLAFGWIDNHSVRGYDKLLANGFGGLLKKVEAEFDKYPITSGERVERENFLNSAATVCKAGMTFGRRLAERAEAVGMPETAANCRAVEEGAFSFASAVQLLWIGHLIGCAEDGLNANSIGRLDQLLWPYYETDLKKGLITPDKAHEIMVELAIKMYRRYDVQAITLGGTNRDGSCAVNELTGIIIDASADFGELRDLSLRVHSDMPDAIWEKAAKMVLRGGGIPFFFNDTCFIKALNDRGIAIEDARNYAPIGCVELTIPGKANSHAVAGWFNMLKVMEITVNGGCDILTGAEIFPGSKKMEDYVSYDEFYQAFLGNIETAAAGMVYDCRRGGKKQRNYGPITSFSLLTDDCISRGKDISDGGAFYNWFSICLCGVPDTADSLTAIRKLIFEEKKIDSARLVEALRNDFKEDEALRLMLINGAPKYGNDIPEADAPAADISKYFIDLMDEWSEPYSKFFVHIFSFTLNVRFGMKTAATPNGRHSKKPFAYSLSAHPGMDKNGVGSMLKSLAKMPHSMAAGASAAIIDIHPSIFNNTDGVKLFSELMKYAFYDLGIGQLQWNFVSGEDMVRAKNNPEKYGTLQVRVAGYSQMFQLIPPELQDHLINRTKHVK